MNKNIIIAILFLLLVGIATYIAAEKFSCYENKNSFYVEKRNISYKSVPTDPVIITKVKTRIVRTSDTVIMSNPFIARIDTVIRHDTIKAEYEYPANLFSLTVLNHPDTIRTEQVILTEPKEKRDEWWVKPLIFTGGLLGGYIFGRIK